jgi:ABC-type transport system involved in multi-copper enzyme maturation permease subunit
MAPINPVLRRELKERMRTRRTGYVLTIYLAVLSLVLYALYNNARRQQVGGLDPLLTASLGRGMFESLLFAVLLMVCFLVPGYTAGAIVGERERQTLIPMQVTQLSATSIVIGKLLASLAYLLLLLVATAPLLAVSFFFGGVTLGEMLRGVAMVAVTGVVLASVSLAVSTLARRVQSATVIAYGLALLLTAGTLVFYGFEGVVSTSPGTHNKAVLVFNPIVATAESVAGKSTAAAVSSPLTSLHNLLVGTNVAVAAGAGPSIGPVPTGSIVSGLATINPPNGHRPPYLAESLGCFLLITLGSLVIAVRRTTTPGASDRA